MDLGTRLLKKPLHEIKRKVNAPDIWVTPHNRVL